MAAPAPKLDFKMLIVPAILFFSKKLDMKDPNLVQLLRTGFGTVIVLVLALYYYLYTRVNSNKDTRKIWVPPKPKPTLPFGLGPAPEPIKVSDFEETTYKEYETKLLKEGVQAVLMSGGISFFMSMKFSPMPLLIQSVMIPITMSENLVLRKYLLGAKQNAEGKNLYNEEFTAPTEATVKALNDAAAAANGAAAEEPRVEELPDEPKAKEGKESKDSKGEEKDKKKKFPAAAKEEKKKATDGVDID